MNRNAVLLAAGLALLAIVVLYAAMAERCLGDRSTERCQLMRPGGYRWPFPDWRASLVRTKQIDETAHGVKRDGAETNDANDFMNLANKKEPLTPEEAERWRAIVEKYDGAR